MSEPKEIPENYNESNLKELEKKAIESYKKGDIIESFVVIHGILEMELNIIWNTLVFSVVKINPRPARKSKKYSELVDLLEEFEILDDDQCSILREFETGRNKAVHELATHMKPNHSAEYFDDKFNKALKAFDFVDRAIVTTAKKSFPKFLMPKKT